MREPVAKSEKRQRSASQCEPTLPDEFSTGEGGLTPPSLCWRHELTSMMNELPMHTATQARAAVHLIHADMAPGHGGAASSHGGGTLTLREAAVLSSLGVRPLCARRFLRVLGEALLRPSTGAPLLSITSRVQRL